MHESATARDACRDHSGMDLALRAAFPEPGEHLQVRFVLDVGGLAQQLDFSRRLHPAYRVHQRGAVEQLRVRQLPLDVGPSGGGDVSFLEAELFPVEPERAQHPGRTLDSRLDIVLDHLDALNPRVAFRHRASGVMRDDDRLAGTRPDAEHVARGIGEIEMPAEGARIGDAGEIREVFPGARNDGGAARLVHEAVQPLDVDEHGLFRGDHPFLRIFGFVIGGEARRGHSFPYLSDMSMYHIRNEMPRALPQPAFRSAARRARARAVSRCST